MLSIFDSFVQKLLSEAYEWKDGILYKDGERMFEEEPDAPEEEEFEELTLDGEYWFDEFGLAMYADGDIGDMNHEAHVIQTCISELMGMFNIWGNEPYLETDSPIENEMVEQIISELSIEDDDEKEKKIEQIKNDPANAIINYLIEDCDMDKDKASDLVMTAYGSMRDAREYAIKNWNWVRVVGDSIEVNKLDKNTLSNVAKGINDALNQEGLCDTDEDWQRAGKSTYSISTYTGKRYNITLDDMEKGNVSGLEEAGLENTVSAATKQVRDMDIEAMPDYYKSKGIIGDSKTFDEFVQIITEGRGEDMYAWLSPSGETHAVLGQAHGDWAEKYLKGKASVRFKTYDGVLRVMFKLGWCRINYIGANLYCHNTIAPPSTRQLNKLKDIAINHQMDHIIWDNEKNDRVLWAKQDY